MAVQSYQLTLRSGPTPGKVFELTHGEMTIGRDVSNHIVINDPEVSRKHARLLTQAGGFMIEDLGSTNGTFVGNQRLLGPHLLRHGETIMLGENVELTFEAMLFDPNATVVSGAAAAPSRDTYVVSAQPPPTVPEPYSGQQVPAYSGEVPMAPSEPYEAEPVYEEPAAEKKSNKTMLYVGIGCVVLLLCACVVGAFVFDSLDLYCEPPFDALFSCP